MFTASSTVVDSISRNYLGGSGEQLGHTGGLGFTLTLAHQPQDVFLVIWRHKTTIFTDAKESSRMFKLKRNVEGILKWLPEEQRYTKMTNSWMMARHWVNVTSPAKQHGHRPQPQQGWPSGWMTPLGPCASSCSTAHPSCPM